jgi:anti-sigma B factor antagonist/stage II sporulation protein AA (anti-sigma F factor antagonist)
MKYMVDVEARTVRLAGDLDLASAPDLIRAVASLDGTSGDLVVDLAEVEFLDSSGLRAIFDIARSMQGRGRVVLLRPAPQARRVLEMVDAASFVEIRFD